MKKLSLSILVCILFSASGLAQTKGRIISTIYQLDQGFEPGSEAMYTGSSENKYAARSNDRALLNTVKEANLGFKVINASESITESDNSITYYAAPASNTLIIKSSETEEIASEYLVYNMKGRLIRIITADIDTDKAILDISSLKCEMYLIQSPGSERGIKIMKQ